MSGSIGGSQGGMESEAGAVYFCFSVFLSARHNVEVWDWYFGGFAIRFGLQGYVYSTAYNLHPTVIPLTTDLESSSWHFTTTHGSTESVSSPSIRCSFLNHCSVACCSLTS